MEEIRVPFLSKKEALSLGAIFDRCSRKWFIPDGLNQEHSEKLRNLDYKTENPKEDFSGHTYMRQQYYNWDESNHDQDSVSVSDEKSQNDISDSMQKEENLPNDAYEIPNGLSTLKAAIFIFENGMPENEQDRIKLLRALGQRNRTNYPISYEGMLSCESFERYYPPSLLSELCFNRITGARRLEDEIADMDISEEQKAFLLFALPLREGG